MKTLKILFTILFLFASLPCFVRAQIEYLDVGSIEEIPYPVVSNGQYGFVYFDLSEIKVTSPIYLDVVSVSNVYNGSQFVKYGTWNINQGGGSFADFEYFYEQSVESEFNDIIFVQLRPGAYKDVVVIRGDQLWIYQNQGGEIRDPQTLNLGGPGYNLDTGFFSIGGVHKDLVVRVGTTTLKFYKNEFNGTLSHLYTNSSFINLTGVKMCQMDQQYPPYLPDDPSNREDVIISMSMPDNKSRIQIYKNNNMNGLGGIFDSVIDLNFHLTDFQIADFTEDGYNDIIASGHIGSATDWVDDLAQIHVNVQGVFMDKNPRVVFNKAGYIIGNENKVAIADFNKDGWNDIIFTAETQLNQETVGITTIFINQKGVPLFRTGVDDYDQKFFMPEPWDVPICVKAVDIYNTGGIAFLASYRVGLVVSPGYGIKRVNAVLARRDPPPPPPIVVGTLEPIPGQPDHYYPKLIMSNRGERDFYQYHIWKESPTHPYSELPTTSNNEFIDYNECVLLGGDVPNYNCYYEVKSEDLHLPLPHQLSDFSTPVNYTVGCQPTCAGCDGDNFSISYNSNTNSSPEMYQLTNHPNPFNPATTVTFSLPRNASIKLEVFDLLGRKVAELVNKFMQAGTHNIQFDATNLSSGVYFYVLKTPDYMKTSRMLLMK